MVYLFSWLCSFTPSFSPMFRFLPHFQKWSTRILSISVSSTFQLQEGHPAACGSVKYKESEYVRIFTRITPSRHQELTGQDQVEQIHQWIVGQIPLQTVTFLHLACQLWLNGGDFCRKQERSYQQTGFGNERNWQVFQDAARSELSMSSLCLSHEAVPYAFALSEDQRDGSIWLLLLDINRWNADLANSGSSGSVTVLLGRVRLRKYGSKPLFQSIQHLVTLLPLLQSGWNH